MAKAMATAMATAMVTATTTAMATLTAMETALEMGTATLMATGAATEMALVMAMSTATATTMAMAMAMAMATATATTMAMSMVWGMATVMVMATATATATQRCHRSLPSHRCHCHVSHHCASPPSCHLHLIPSPPSCTPPFPTHHCHHCWLIVVCLWVGGASTMILSLLALPPPPSIFLTSLYLPCLPHHCPPCPPGSPWLIDCYFKNGWRGECAFYCNRLVTGRSPGHKLCVHASFFDKTTPATKKATNRDHQGMLKVIQHTLTVAKL